MRVVRDPTITVLVKGAVAVVVPAVSWRPVGEEAKLRSTVWGSRRTDWVSVSPVESRAVSRISR